MRNILLASAALIGFATAMPAAAQSVTYDYGSSLDSAVFSYGYGTAGTSFTPFGSSFTGGCFGVGTLACKTSGGSSDLPGVVINTGLEPVTFYTNTLPSGTLFIQPGFASSGQDAIVNFIAPFSGSFTFSGTINRIDTTNNGNGVNLSAFVNNQNIFGNGGNYYLAPIAGNSIGFGSVTTLKKGDTFTLGVNNNGDTYYDGTGITGTITAIAPSAVPEPATWAMMMVGFGMIGFGMRRRSKVSTTVKFA